MDGQTRWIPTNFEYNEEFVPQSFINRNSNRTPSNPSLERQLTRSTPQLTSLEGGLTPTPMSGMEKLAGIGIGFNAVTGLVKAGLDYDIQNRQLGLNSRQVDINQMDAETRKSTLGFQREAWQRNWDAAQRAGLYSPDQFGTSQGYFANQGNSSIFAYSRLASATSPFRAVQ